MDIKKEIGKLFVVGFQGKEINSDLKRLIHDYHIGSVILFSHNIGTPEELLQLTTDLQKEAKNAEYEQPLLIAADEENGTVKRLDKPDGDYPGAMATSATNDSKYAYEIGRATGDDLLQVGINWNFAPVLDVNNNPNNPVIGVRSFGETADVVTEFGLASMRGLQDSHVATSIKHFPGHGDTNMDSHYSLPRIDHSIERLQNIELIPFKAAIEQGADSIMTAHIVFPALEPTEGKPATLSKNIMTGLLRKELGFNGVIVTDALEMEAISETIGIPNGAVEVLKAGVDMLLIGHYPEQQFAALQKVEDAVSEGIISIERIQESVNRVKQLKNRYTSWETLNLENSTVSASFNNTEKKALAKEAYEKSVTVLKEGEKLEKEQSVLVLQPKDELRTIAEDVSENSFVLAQTVKKYIKNTEVYLTTNNISKDQYEEILHKADRMDRIIVGTMVSSKDSEIVKLINQLSEKYRVDLISMKSPYIGQWIQNNNYWINTYEPNKLPVDIAIRTLLGEVNPTGVSPVSLIY